MAVDDDIDGRFAGKRDGDVLADQRRIRPVFQILRSGRRAGTGPRHHLPPVIEGDRGIGCGNRRAGRQRAAVPPDAGQDGTGLQIGIVGEKRILGIAVDGDAPGGDVAHGPLLGIAQAGLEDFGLAQGGGVEGGETGYRNSGKDAEED